MLADLVDHVIGVDPAKNVFMAVVVDAQTRGEIAGREFRTTAGGYRAVLEWADEAATVSEARVWSIEGAGSYGSGLAQMLAREQEWVPGPVGPATRSWPSGGSTNLDGGPERRSARPDCSDQ